MPHYQIWMRNGKAHTRCFNDNMRFFTHVINMKWYVFLTSSIGTPSERAINELSPRHALHLYFNAKVAGELSIVKVDSILSCDWIDAAFMFEDEKLGIVYLRDQKLIQPVIDVLKQGLPLIRINPPK